MGTGLEYLAAAAIGGGAGIWAASESSDAMQDASSDSVQAQMAMYGQQRADQEPWRGAGETALQDLYGTEPVYARDLDYRENEEGNVYEGDDIVWTGNNRIDFEQGNLNQNDIVGYRRTGEGLLDQRPDVGAPPVYDAPERIDPYSREMYEGSAEHDFLLEEGTRALTRGLGARGHNQSGAEKKALLRYGQGLASTQYTKAADEYYRGANFGLSQDYDRANFGLGQYYDSANFQLGNYYQSLNPYMSLAGMGQINSRPPYAGVGGSILAGGQGEAAGYINSANVLSQGVSSGVDNWNLYNYLNPSSTTPVSGSTGGTGGYPGVGTYGVSPGSQYWH